MKTLLIVISSATLFFTSCEKDEMGPGGTGGGGGMENSFKSKNVSTFIITENDTVITTTALQEQPVELSKMRQPL